MREKTGICIHTLDSSCKTYEIGLRQQPATDTRVTETSAEELTLKLLGERIKQATDPIFRRVEELCALLLRRTEMESNGNSEASGWRRNIESISPSSSWHDSVTMTSDGLR